MKIVVLSFKISPAARPSARPSARPPGPGPAEPIYINSRSTAMGGCLIKTPNSPVVLSLDIGAPKQDPSHAGIDIPSHPSNVQPEMEFGGRLEDFQPAVYRIFCFLPQENRELKHRGPTANFEYVWEKVEPIQPLSDKVFERLGL